MVVSKETLMRISIETGRNFMFALYKTSILNLLRVTKESTKVDKSKNELSATNGRTRIETQEVKQRTRVIR
jgi:hypothetical protein